MVTRPGECYLADDNGRNEITVTETSTKKILYVTLSNRGLDAVARENLDEEQLILYNALNTTLGNRNYLWDTGSISGGSGGMDYEIPPEALEDEEFAADDPGSGEVSGSALCMGRIFSVRF